MYTHTHLFLTREIKIVLKTLYAEHGTLCRQLDAAEFQEQRKRAQQEAEKCQGPFQDNLKTIPADYFYLCLPSQPTTC